jgi:beta-lactamase class A
MGIGAVTILAGCANRGLSSAGSELARLEASLGGRIGVSALDLQTSRRIAHRADERFAMCSTFKWALAAHVLAVVSRDALEGRLAYTKANLVPYSPVTEPKVSEGSMTIRDLCAAAVTISDNTAANLLLRHVGGPSAFTAFLRRTGDDVTRLDRMEPDLNENAPGDPRDTTTPAAMVGSLHRLLFGNFLGIGGRELLQGWMRSSTTGLDRLRAGLPAGWVAGDKTGTCANGASNDVGFAFPPNRSRPILIASYIEAPVASAEHRNAAHKQIAMRVAAQLI